MRAPTLHELQKCFGEAVTNPDFCLDKLNWIKATPNFSLSDRMEVYRYAYRARMLESLTEDFLQVQLHLGKDRFSNLAHLFISDVPSTYASLAEVSREFPKFLRERLPAGKEYVFDLARLEWACIVAETLVFDSSLDLESLSRISEDERNKVRLALHPGASLIESGWSISSLLKTGDTIPRRYRTRLLISPSSDSFEVSRVSRLEREILEKIKSGITIGNLTHFLVEKGMQENRISASFLKWGQKGVIVWSLENLELNFRSSHQRRDHHGQTLH